MRPDAVVAGQVAPDRFSGLADTESPPIVLIPDKELDLDMRASIIVPTRNRPLELKKSLSAIAAQTYQDIEIVVIDDGSSVENALDNKSLVDEFGKKVAYINLLSDGLKGNGPSYPRNVGIERAAGELIAFCDDDDYWCDDQYIASAVNAFSADSSLDFMFANQAAHIDGQVVSDVWLPLLVNKLAARAESSQYGALLSKSDALTDGHAHVNTCVFRKHLLREIGGFWESVRYQEDLDLFVRAVDSARHIKYFHQTVSIHNIPDRTRSVNASTQLDSNGKAVAEADVANHLTQCCRSIEARRYANQIGGFAYRKLALAASKAKDYRTAFIFAKVAWSWRPTVKWTGYTIFLGCKALLSSNRALPQKHR